MSDTDDRDWLKTLAGQISAGRSADRPRGQSDDDPVIDPSALEGNPFERKATWRTAVRATGTRGWAAAALAVAALALGMHLAPRTTTSETVRTSPDGVVRLADPNPRALRQQIVGELRAAGVQANGYAQLDIDGIDADLALPISADVERLLASHRIPAPADGALRLQISSQK
jgi:hypothetical protein